MFLIHHQKCFQALQECSRPFQSLQQSIVFWNTNVFVSYGITIEDSTNLVRSLNVTNDNTLHVRLTMQSQHELYTEFFTSTLWFQTKRRNCTKGDIMIYADLESVVTALRGILLHTPGITKKSQENKDICDPLHRSLAQYRISPYQCYFSVSQ